MASLALQEWQNSRTTRLDQLFGVHVKVDPRTGPGRRVGTEQLNLALMVKLSAEWQGFARDLHNEATDRFAARVEQAGSAQGGERLRVLLTQHRRLDRGNADWSALTEDFARLGLVGLPSKIHAHDPRYGKASRGHLDHLMTAKNGVVHDDQAKLQQLRAAGVSLNLVTVKRWRAALDRLVGSMDRVVSDHLGAVFNEQSPWQDQT